MTCDSNGRFVRTPNRPNIKNRRNRAAADHNLGPDEYLDADLIGLRLLNENGDELARVVGVEHYPAQDCLVVEPGRALVPLVKAFIKHIDLVDGSIVTSLPDGLL